MPRRLGLCLTLVLSLSGPFGGYAGDSYPDEGGRSLQIAIRGNQVTLEGRDVSVEGALSALAGAAGLRLRIRGHFGGRRGSWAFRDLSLKDAVIGIIGKDGWVLVTGGDRDGQGKPPTLFVVATPSEQEPLSDFHPSLSGSVPTATGCTSQSLPPAVKKGTAHLDGAKSLLTSSLAEAIQDSSMDDVRSAITALEMMGADAATRELASGLAAKEPDVRTEIVHALGRIGTDEAILVLAQEFYGDSDPAVRKQAMEALANQPSDMAQLFLNKPLHGGDGVDVSAH